MTINKLFNLLDDWRNLPSYQLERRADIFFAIHLDKIFENVLGTKIDFILPEFPVRIGELPEQDPGNNQSFKIDYLAFSKEENKVYLIELKTDQKSRRQKQDWYLENAAKIKVKGLIKGLIHIYKVTKQKIKYTHLLEKIENIGWIKRDGKTILNMNVEIEPSVVYIQPLNKNDVASIICFDDIIEALSGSTSPLTERFIKSLKNWKRDPNKQ